jgi:hypothetical protein
MVTTVVGGKSSGSTWDTLLAAVARKGEMPGCSSDQAHNRSIGTRSGRGLHNGQAPRSPDRLAGSSFAHAWPITVTFHS